MVSFSFGMFWEDNEAPEVRGEKGGSSIWGALTTAQRVVGPVLGFLAKTIKGDVEKRLGPKRVRDARRLVNQGRKFGEAVGNARAVKQRKDVLFLSFDHAFTLYTSLTFVTSLYLFFPFSLRHLKVLLISMASIYLYMKYYTYDTPAVESLLIRNDMWCIIAPLVFAAMALFLCVTMKLLNFIVIFGAPSLVAILIIIKGCTNWFDSVPEVESRQHAGGKNYPDPGNGQGRNPDEFTPVGEAAVEGDVWSEY